MKSVNDFHDLELVISSKGTSDFKWRQISSVEKRSSQSKATEGKPLLADVKGVTFSKESSKTF